MIPNSRISGLSIFLSSHSFHLPTRGPLISFNGESIRKCDSPIKEDRGHGEGRHNHIIFAFSLLFPIHKPVCLACGGGREKRTKQICLSPELLFSPIPFIREPVGHILGSLKQSCPTGSRIKEIGGRDLKESHDLAGYNQLLERKPGHDFNTSSRHTLTSGKLTNDRQVFSSFNHTCRSYG